MLRRVVTASALCALFFWGGAAAPNDEARKIKLAEGLRAKAAKARAAGLALATQGPLPAFAADGGYEESWEQSSWGGRPQKQWNGKNSYWKKTDDVNLTFMEPWVAPAYAWAARRDLPLTTANRFAVSSAAGKTCILCGGVGTTPYAGTGVVSYAEDREGANWKTSPVSESGGFKAKGVFDLCWAPKSTSGNICAATSMQSLSTPKTPLFYYPGPVPMSQWVSAVESSSIPPRTVYNFNAIAPERAGTGGEVYLGYSGGSIGTARLYGYRDQPRTWKDIGKLIEAKDVHSLCTIDTGFLAGTGPKALVYEWNKTQEKLTPRSVGTLVAGDVLDLAKVGGYVYAAVGNSSPEPKARLFRAKDNYAQWEDVTPKGSAVAALKGFRAVAAFGKDGAVGALGDSFEQVFVARAPGPAGWGLVKGDGGSGKDLVHVMAGTDFWGNFVACEKDGVYARKFQGFKSGGVLYSSVFDSRDKLVEYKKLEFEGALASGGARFWLRAARDYDALKNAEGGGSGEPPWVDVSPGQPLPGELSGKRYIQYKVQLDVPDGKKFPPVVKKVRLVTFQTYGKVTGTSPVNSATNQKIDVAIKFVFSKDVRRETITRYNLKIKGKEGEEYAWWDENPPYTDEFVINHEKFKAYDEITVVLESIKDREILDYWGEEIDPDGDGERGGVYKFSFSVGKDGGGETEGPKVYDVAVEPNPTYGAKDVEITATADDTETGRSNIVAAEYSFGRNPAPAGMGEPMEGDFGHHPKITVWATADIGGLAQGEERLMVYVRAKDVAGNWGDPTAAPIFVRPPEFLPKEYVYFYPNPCRGDVGYFHYLVTKKSNVKVRVYDMRGRLVDEIEAEVQAFSSDSLRWDISGVGADVYVFRLTARAREDGEQASVTKKLAVLR